MTESSKYVSINVGVLGHVDSGKTSLCKALSTTASTAAFDSSPQSKERGITLDLGFSSFVLKNKWLCTLVDCPGHSSLIRTMIGGAQIMDIMILVIDINKGMQAQAGECLILAHIMSSHLIVVLNKVDLIPEDKQTAKIEKAMKLLRSTLSKTKFENEPIVAVSALDPSIGTESIKDTLLKVVENVPFNRNINSPFIMAVDHCFSIKGQGTVVTGTVIQGRIKINDMVEFPTLQMVKKVKSIQIYRVSVDSAAAGDRVGLCIPGLDSSLIERSLICAAGCENVMQGVKAGVAIINKVPFFKRPIKSKHRYHISIGYDTYTALLTLFKPVEREEAFSLDNKYQFVEQIDEKTADGQEEEIYYGLLEFDQPALNNPNNLIIGSDLQSGEEGTCRLAFHGKIFCQTMEKSYVTTFLPSIKIFRDKSKEGSVDRVVSDNAIIAKGFCKRNSNIAYLLGLKVSIIIPDAENAVVGTIDSRFGQTNKVRITLDSPLSENEKLGLKDKGTVIKLNFKKFLFSPAKHESGPTKLIQN